MGAGCESKTKQRANKYLFPGQFPRQETILIFAALMTVSGVNPIIETGVIFIVFEVNPFRLFEAPRGLSDC